MNSSEIICTASRSAVASKFATTAASRSPLRLLFALAQRRYGLFVACKRSRTASQLLLRTREPQVGRARRRRDGGGGHGNVSNCESAAPVSTATSNNCAFNYTSRALRCSTSSV